MPQTSHKTSRHVKRLNLQVDAISLT